MIKIALLMMMMMMMAGIIHGQDIKFAFVIDESQNDLTQWISDVLRGVESENDGLKLIDEIIQSRSDDENIAFEGLCSVLSKGVTIILDLKWSPCEKCHQLATSNNVPYLRVDLSIRPFLNGLTSFLLARNATDTVLVLQNEDEIDQTIYYFIESSALRMMVLKEMTQENADRLLKMRPSPSYYSLVGKSENLIKYYQMAKTTRLTHRQDRWTLVQLDFSESEYDLLNATALVRPDPSICCRLINAEPCVCPGDFNLPFEFFRHFTTVLIDLVKNSLEIRTLQCDEPEVFDLEKTQALYDRLATGDSTFYFVVDKLMVQPNVKMNVHVQFDDAITNAAQWSFVDDLEVLDPTMIFAARNFFRIGTSEAVPWSMKERDPDTGEVILNEDGSIKWTGYCIDMMQAFADRMNFDYEIVIPENGTFGKRVDGEKWDGVVGDLKIGKTDFAVAALVMTAEREEVVDFVAPYFEQTGILITIRQPVPKTSLFKFMTVLKTEVWLSIVGAVIVTAFMIWFLDKYSPYSSKNNKKAYPYPCRDFTLKESFWFALTSFTPQGGGEAPKALSGRTLVAAYWLFVVLMLATFTANLAAFLTVERMQTPVASLEQLARQSRIKYTVVENSTTHTYFINMKHAEDTMYRMWKELTLNASNDQTQYQIWDYPIKEQWGHILLAINESDPVANATVGFAKVVDHAEADFAFIHDSAEIKYELSMNCNLTVIGEVFGERPYGVAVQQGSYLNEELSKTVLDLQKDRFFEDLQAKYWNNSRKGKCANSDDAEGITLESLGGVFIATLFGLLLALITLVGEVYYYKRKAKNEVTDAFMTKEKLDLRRNEKDPVTIGTAFKPVGLEKAEGKISHISVYPRYRFQP